MGVEYFPSGLARPLRETLLSLIGNHKRDTGVFAQEGEKRASPAGDACLLLRDVALPYQGVQTPSVGLKI